MKDKFPEPTVPAWAVAHAEAIDAVRVAQAAVMNLVKPEHGPDAVCYSRTVGLLEDAISSMVCTTTEGAALAHRQWNYCQRPQRPRTV